MKVELGVKVDRGDFLKFEKLLNSDPDNAKLITLTMTEILGVDAGMPAYFMLANDPNWTALTSGLIKKHNFGLFGIKVDGIV